MDVTFDNSSKSSTPVVDQRPDALANEILRRAGIAANDVNSLPIDLDAITNVVDVKVYVAEFEDPDISGMLILDPKRVPASVEPGKAGTIFLKNGEYPLRSRFTLAHEIGHVVLGHRNDGVITDFYRGRLNGHSSTAERDANEFAAELLMPRQLFADFWNSGVPEEDLSIVFGVSVTAAAVRAKALGLRSRYEY